MPDEIRAWLHGHLPIVPPCSALGKAVNYAHRQWPKLIVYLEDSRLRIDNNLTENAIRPFIIGRKNFLFCDTTHRLVSDTPNGCFDGLGFGMGTAEGRSGLPRVLRLLADGPKASVADG